MISHILIKLHIPSAFNFNCHKVIYTFAVYYDKKCILQILEYTNHAKHILTFLETHKYLFISQTLFLLH